MAVNILSVSLEDDTIEKIAQRVAQIIGNGHSTTQGNPPQPQTTQPAEPQGFQQQAPSPQNQGWTNNPPPTNNVGQPQQQAPAQQYQQGPPQQQYQQDPSAPPPGPVPTCAHGEKRWVPPGFSQNSGKSYRGFYACPAPRGQQCPR